MNMPDCGCGKKATTRINDLQLDEITYVCDKCFRELFPWNQTTEED